MAPVGQLIQPKIYIYIYTPMHSLLIIFIYPLSSAVCSILEILMIMMMMMIV